MARETTKGTGEERLLRVIFVDEGGSIRPTVNQGGTIISMREAITRTLNTFPKKTSGRLRISGDLLRKILVLRFGLEKNQPHTLEAIGEVLKQPRRKIKEYENIALRLLRHPSRSQQLRPFFEEEHA